MISTEEYESLLEESIYNFYGESVVKDIEFCDFFSEQAIAEDVELFRDILLNEAAKELSPEEQKRLDKALKDNKDVKNAKKASAAVKKAFGIDLVAVGTDIAKYAVKVIQKEGMSKSSKDKINKYWNDQMEALAGKIAMQADGKAMAAKFADNKDFKKYLEDNKGSRGTKLKSALGLFIRMLLVMEVEATILTILFGTAGQVLHIVLVGPLIEESAKVVSVKGNYAVEFALVFNVFEFSKYVTTFKGIYPNIAKIRLLTVGMHLTTTFIHYLTQHPELLKKVKLDKIAKIDENKPTNIALGSFLGWLVHVVWNGGAGTKLIQGLGLLDDIAL